MCDKNFHSVATKLCLLQIQIEEQLVLVHINQTGGRLSDQVWPHFVRSVWHPWFQAPGTVYIWLVLNGDPLEMHWLPHTPTFAHKLSWVTQCCLQRVWPLSLHVWLSNDSSAWIARLNSEAGEPNTFPAQTYIFNNNLTKWANLFRTFVGVGTTLLPSKCLAFHIFCVQYESIMAAHEQLSNWCLRPTKSVLQIVGRAGDVFRKCVRKINDSAKR